MNRTSYVLIGLVIALMLVAGCLSGPLPEDLPKPTPSESQTPPPLPLESLSYISVDSLNYSVNPDFTGIVPELNGLVFLPNNNPVDVVSNDLSVLSHPRRLQILASIADKTSGVYVQPQRDSNMLIYFTAYMLNDTETALELLVAYRSAWNQRLLNTSGVELWIWDGYLDEIAGKARPQGKDTIIYWDPQNQATFIHDKVLSTHPALSKTETILYSVHGETAFENYFIMIDIKARLNDIQNQTDKIFNEAARDILKINLPLPVEPSTKNVLKASSVALELSDFSELGWTKSDEKITNSTYIVEFGNAKRFSADMLTNTIAVYPNFDGAMNDYQQKKTQIENTFSTEDLDIGDGGFMYSPGGSVLYTIFVDKNVVVTLEYLSNGIISQRFNEEIAKMIDDKI